MLDALAPTVATAGPSLPLIFPFAMELVVVVLFAVVAFPIWLFGRLVESYRRAT